MDLFWIYYCFVVVSAAVSIFCFKIRSYIWLVCMFLCIEIQRHCIHKISNWANRVHLHLDSVWNCLLNTPYALRKTILTGRSMTREGMMGSKWCAEMWNLHISTSSISQWSLNQLTRNRNRGLADVFQCSADQQTPSHAENHELYSILAEEVMEHVHHLIYERTSTD